MYVMLIGGRVPSFSNGTFAKNFDQKLVGLVKRIAVALRPVVRLPKVYVICIFWTKNRCGEP